MATFTGQLISATYDAILKTIDNDAIGGTAKQLTDGLGNVTPLYVSTTQLGIGITPTEVLHVSGNIKASATVLATTFSGDLSGTINTATTGTTQTLGDDTTKIATTAFVQASHAGKPTGSGTGGKIALWSGSGVSTTLTDSAITQESTQFVVFKDIRISDNYPSFTLEDNDSAGSAAKGDIVWLDNAAAQKAIISLNNSDLGITSKGGALTFGTNSTPAASIDASQNTILQGNLTTGGNGTTNSGAVTINGGISQNFSGSAATTNFLSIQNTATAAASSDASQFKIIQKDTSAADIVYSQGLIATGNAYFGTLEGTGSVKGMNLNIATGNATFSGTLTAGNTLVDGTLGVTSTLTSADITTGNISAGNGIFSGGITANGTSVTNTFKSTVLINRVGQVSSLLIGSNSLDDVLISFQTDGNSMSMGIDRSDGNAFKISDAIGLGTNDRFKIDTSGNSTFTGDVALTGSGAKIISAISSDSDSSLFLSGAGSGKDTHIVFGGDRNLYLSKSSSATAVSEGTPVLTLDTSSNATFAGTVTAAGATMTADTTFNSNIILEGNIFHKDDTNTYFGFNTGSSTDDVITFATNNVQRLTIDSSGNSTFAGSLHVISADNQLARFESTDAYGGIEICDDTSGTAKPLISALGNAFIFYNGGSSHTEAMRIDSSQNATFTGNVTVGAPVVGRLGVRGTTNDSSAYSFEAANSSGNSLLLVRNDGQVSIPSGNVGIGLTPVTGWGASSEVIQLGDGVSDYGALAWNTISGADHFDLMYQSYFDGTNYKYGTGSAAVSAIRQRNGEIFFSRKDGGTANATFTWDDSLKIDSSGNVKIATPITNAFYGLSLQYNATDTADFTVNQATGQIKIGGVAAGYFPTFYSGGSERMRIDSSGTTTITNGTNDNTLLLLNGARGRRLRVQEHNTGNGGIAITSQDDNETGTTNSNNRTILLNASGGNVGIGTTASPLQKLHLEEAGATSVYAEWSNNSRANNAYMGLTVAGKLVIQNNTDISFDTGASYTERMRITSAGYLKASNDGTYFSTAGPYHELRQSSPANWTTIVNNTSATPYGLYMLFSGASPNNTQEIIYFADSTAQRFYVTSAGAVYGNGTYGTISDRKLKENIEDATTKLDDINKLKVRNFNFKDKPEEKHIGFIAQEFEEVFPKAVENTPDKDSDGKIIEDSYTKTIKTSILIPMLVKAIQELKAEIEILKKQCKCK